MTYEDVPTPCLKCGGEVPDAGDPAAGGVVFTAQVGPLEDLAHTACEFEIGVCGPCLTQAGNAGRVLRRAWPLAQPTVSLWPERHLRPV